MSKGNGTEFKSANKSSRNSRKKRIFFLWIGIAFLAVVVIVSSVRFYESLQEQLFNERQSHLTEMTIKVSEVLDTTIETVQSKTESAGVIIDETIEPTSDSMMSIMEQTARYIDLETGVLLAMDDRGMVYSSDGYFGRWENTEDLIRDDIKPVIRELTLGHEKTAYMVFFRKLKTEKKIDGTDSSLTHVAVAVPLDTMKEVFSFTMFGNDGYTYLVNNSGRRLYKQTFSQSFIEEYNVISVLEKEQFVMGGDIEDLNYAVANRQQFCAEFRYSEYNENYFVSTVPLGNSEWTVVLFVPTSVLGAQTNKFMTSVITFFAVVAVTMTLVFAGMIYATIINRSDKKLMEQQENANVQLAKAAEEAQAANKAKSEFLSHMSHDIRTPINGIVGMTNIAMKNTTDPLKVQECLRKISGAADHLLTLINDVLDMSRIESGKVTIAHEPLDIRVLLDACYSIIGGQLLSRKVDFMKEFGEFKHPYLLGDELHLRQIFINILGNAVKFTPDGGRISFKAVELENDNQESDKAIYRFIIKDSGIGMTEEFQTRIFEAFSQENGGSRTEYKGTGLGMAITKKFVDLMDGSITVESRLGEGSCFTVDIVFDIDRDVKQQTEEHTVVCLEGMNVLLVEDNELNMEIAREILEDEGVNITCAENGKIAVDTFLSKPEGTFDAILMDIMMPVMNGYEATRAIRKSSHAEASTIPIIAMTANAYAEDVQTALAAGMSAHVAKPIDLNKLFSVLNEYKRQK
jgi:signal transduction histidine kinase/BarA-like signal transduction histidine kinase